MLYCLLVDESLFSVFCKEISKLVNSMIVHCTRNFVLLDSSLSRTAILSHLVVHFSHPVTEHLC